MQLDRDEENNKRLCFDGDETRLLRVVAQEKIAKYAAGLINYVDLSPDDVLVASWENDERMWIIDPSIDYIIADLETFARDNTSILSVEDELVESSDGDSPTENNYFAQRRALGEKAVELSKQLVESEEILEAADEPTSFIRSIEAHLQDAAPPEA